mmetsp:Transcript_2450/g.2834  ORF Transcript_2450/g.2834 Transcript_2450/m.2834 type:complete len:201 (-) Transcript_2450:277-879(-)
MAGLNPMSSIWSASSKMSTLIFLIRSAKAGVLSRWSCNRPGVATRKSTRSRFRRSFFMSRPPKITVIPKSWKVNSFNASAPICEASSRVGERIRQEMGRLPDCLATAGALRIVSTAGTRNAKVFPVPVLAFARTSKPSIMIGNVAACTGVMWVYPSPSWIPRFEFSEIGKDANVVVEPGMLTPLGVAIGIIVCGPDPEID